jgi:hypothetical protein
MDIERVFSIYARYQEYSSLRCCGCSKRYARAEAGISRHYADQIEAAEELAMLSRPVAAHDPNDIPF